jgi:predicted secreted protein
MKRVIATLIAVAFGATLLSAPTVALSHPGYTCNPPSGHGRSGCHRVTTTPVPVASIPGTPTVTSRPAGPAKVKVRKNLTLSGTVSPTAETTGTVTIVKTRKIGRKWKSAGTATVTLVNGTYSYSFKPTKKGQWRFVAKYAGTWDGAAGWGASTSAAKAVKVK